MKTIIIYLLSMSFLPVALSAQPVVTENEFYNTGTVIQMVNCNTSGVVAGAPGADVTWNFSTLTPSGGFSTTSIEHDTSAMFSTASLMEILPNGTIAFLQETGANSYIDGIYDTGTGITTYYNNYDVAKRPFYYDTSYVDSYYVNIPPGTYGAGVLTVSGDSYGTLILPTGTYTNVLRIRKVQTENDTTGSTSEYTTTVSYLWFNTSSNAPLLEIDSISNVAMESQSVTYLSSVTGINNVTNNQNAYSSYFDNSGNLVVNGFEIQKNYVVVLYNIIGNKMLTSEFSATDNSQRFDINRQLSPGIYLVSITVKNDPTAYATVIKVIKSN